MNLDELIRFIGELLPRLKIRYFVYGAFGMNTWMEPRATKDFDIVVYIEKRKISWLAQKLNEKGFRITKMLQRKLSEKRYVILPIGSTRLDIKLCSNRHDRSALERAVAIPYRDTKIFVATPEDIALYKLVAWRPQDRVDIDRLKKEVKGLDKKYIWKWLEILQKETRYPLDQRWKSELS